MNYLPFSSQSESTTARLVSQCGYGVRRKFRLGTITFPAEHPLQHRITGPILLGGTARLEQYAWRFDYGGSMELMHIESGPPLDQVRRLIQEYAASLNFDLCFQHLDRDLRDLPGEYALPYGRLVLATENDRPAGCVAIRRLEPRICEMKRLYVRPEFRRKRLGRILSEHVIAEARIAGYAFMRLDTIAGQMKEAISLYRSLGFREIAPYYYNPIPRALYMELDLR